MSIYETHPIGGNTNLLIRWLYIYPWEMHKFFRVSPYLFVLWWGMVKEYVFRKINIGGDQPLCLQFPSLYEVVSLKNLTVLVVLGNTFLFSWNFTSTKIELL